MEVCVRVVALLLTLTAASQAQVDRGTPPKITTPQGNSWPTSIEYARDGDDKTLTCHGSGEPAPTYMWTLDGEDIAMISRAPVVYDKVTGELTIKKSFTRTYSGFYQCIAQNDHGKAMTPYLQIHATVMTAFAGNSNTTILPTPVIVPENNYLKIRCNNVPVSVPSMIFLWRQKGSDDNAESYVNPNGNKRIDPDGTLHFLWVTKADGQFIYTCVGRNEVMGLDAINTESFTLSVTTSETTERLPHIEYNKDVTVVAGNDAELMCIFSYVSKMEEKLTIRWYFKGNMIRKFGKPVEGNSLILEKVKVPTKTTTQAGEYLCEASIGGKTARGYVNLNIVAPPQFEENRQLMPRSVPLGKAAVFECGTVSYNTYASPTVWMVNAEPIVGCPPFTVECSKKTDGRPLCVKGERCNGYPECPNGSEDLFCDQGSCIEGQIMCNGVCVDKSHTCTEGPCSYPKFKCRAGGKCLEENQICDNVQDCADGSDEVGCSGRENITIDRFVVTSDRSKLILDNVLLTDTMCFQCMSYNDYGILVGDGCLTVIDKIDVVLAPKDMYEIEPKMKLEISVNAITDPQWQQQMKYEWMWYETQVDPDTGDKKTVPVILPPPNFESVFQVRNNGKHLSITVPDVDPEDLDTYNVYNAIKDRQYAVHISHQYDSVFRHFTIEGIAVAPPTPAPAVEEPLWPKLWFVVLIIGILLLFVIVALLVCYLYRNRGGTYLLDKKEVKAGHDPEKELQMDGFTDAGRLGADVKEYDEMLKDDPPY